MNPDRSSEQALKEGQLHHMLSPPNSYSFAVGCKGSVLCLFAMDLLNTPTMYRTAAHLSTHTKMLSNLSLASAHLMHRNHYLPPTSATDKDFISHC